MGGIMKETKEINFNISSGLYARIKQYSIDHKVPIENVIQMALTEFFNIGQLLEGEKVRKEVWDIIDMPDDDC